MSDVLANILRSRRTYANGLEWQEKGLKEWGVVQKWLSVIDYYKNPKPGPENLAPDFVVEDSFNNKVAIEVTELVYRQAIIENENRKKKIDFDERIDLVEATWNEKDLYDGIQERISNKDSKTYHGGPYSKTIVLLHTNEPNLEYLECEKILKNLEFNAKVIDEAYLIFDYLSNEIGYPVIKLNVRKNL